MKYIVDLDDTLVNTTELNNDAYNYALSKFGYTPINTTKRITRHDLQNNHDLKDLIKEKQNYFTAKWLPYRIILNGKLIDKLKCHSKYDCFIWTKADKYRAQTIWNTCNLNQYFADIIFDDKTSFSSSISRLQSTYNDDLSIYENDLSFFNHSNAKIVDVIRNDNFMIKCFQILYREN